MADAKLPYVPTYGVIGRTLKKVKAAATPSRFTQDFLATKLDIKGGSGRPVIPFLKRVGFLGTDGSPTELYKQFRNPVDSVSGAAAAQALRAGYQTLYEMNEYVHDVSDKELKGLVVQATGLEPDASTVRAILGSFKALKSFANFDAVEEAGEIAEESPDSDSVSPVPRPLPAAVSMGSTKFGLSYTINLHLPATSDIAVFDAIFRSLNQHLLR